MVTTFGGPAVRRWMATIVLSASIAVLAACSSATPTPTPTATTSPTPTPVADPIEAGHTLFKANACSRCHGENAEGESAPSLVGVTKQYVLAQVRNPTGLMPAYGESALSDANLDLIATYIASLTQPTTGTTEATPATPQPTPTNGDGGMMGGGGMMGPGM